MGDGPQKEQLIEQASSANVKVRFLGRVPNTELPVLMSQYCIYVLCSNFEGSPKTLLEAMSCGLSVGGTNNPGIKNVIKHNRNGILCESDIEPLG